MKTTTTIYGKFRTSYTLGRRRQGEHLFVQLITQPQTLRGPSPTAWLSRERPVDLYDITQLSAGPSYRNTTISRHERDRL